MCVRFEFHVDILKIMHSGEVQKSRTKTLKFCSLVAKIDITYGWRRL